MSRNGGGVWSTVILSMGFWVMLSSSALAGQEETARQEAEIGFRKPPPMELAPVPPIPQTTEEDTGLKTYPQSVEILLTDSNFDWEVLKSDQLVLVTFWAPWAGPCYALMPTIQEIAKEYAGMIKVAKLDVDAYPDVAKRFHIQSIPTILFFKGGKEVKKSVGPSPKKAHIIGLLNDLLRKFPGRGRSQ